MAVFRVEWGCLRCPWSWSWWSVLPTTKHPDDEMKPISLLCVTAVMVNHFSFRLSLLDLIQLLYIFIIPVQYIEKISHCSLQCNILYSTLYIQTVGKWGTGHWRGKVQGQYTLQYWKQDKTHSAKTPAYILTLVCASSARSELRDTVSFFVTGHGVLSLILL